MKDRTMSMDSKASVCVHPEQHIRQSRPLSLLLATKSSSRPVPRNLTQQPLATATQPLGGSSSGSSSSFMGSGFVYPASSKSTSISTSISYTPVPGVVHEGTANVGHVSPAPLPSPITPNFRECDANEGLGVRSFLKVVTLTLKTRRRTQDSSGFSNRIIVEDENELPSRILNSSFNDALSSSSERTPEASCLSAPSVSVHLRHIGRNISPSPSSEPVLQRRLAPLIIANCTPLTVTFSC
jgi:hypothetical protein